MSEFNPYREWLGIESKSKPTYYQLLGISPRECDAELIKRRAKSRVRCLLSVDADDRADLRDEIIKRIKRSVTCLIDANKRKAYDQQLLHAMQRRATASQQGKLPLQALSQPDSVTTVSSSGLPSPPPSTASDKDSRSSPRQVAGEWTNGKSAPKFRIAQQLKKHRQRSNALLTCIFLGGLSLLGVGYLLGTQTDVLSGVLGLPRSRQEVRPRPTATRIPRLGAASEPAVSSGELAEQAAELADSSSPNSSSSEDETGELHDGHSIPVTAAELRELGRLLTAARAALTERRFGQARELLATAHPLVQRPQDNSKYRRLAMLTDYVEGYWTAASDGLQQVQAGEELMIEDTPVMVVEKSDESLILRSQGRNKTYALQDLPLRLQMFLADRWFNASAASTKVYRGAMMAVSPDFDQDHVRQLWRTARLSGDVDIGDLELVLEDTYDLVP